ncbi:MAG: thiosulfate oxidation carrier complex protein SoxZ [Rhodospirillales bacterium]|nr:thiosulfate oxidation carrier complex protein SoxZ [Rhodospirillales bacterium]
MSTIPMRLIATAQDDGTLLVKALIRHPNHNGFGRDAEGQPIPAHHLTEVVVAVNGEPVVTLYSGSGLAADPLLGWHISGRAGDRISVTWRDNQKNEGQAETQAR